MTLKVNLKKSKLTAKEKLLIECQYLLRKIAKHPDSIKLLINAKAGLEIIANSKAKKRRYILKLLFKE